MALKRIWAGLFVLAGIWHFVKTDIYVSIMPDWLPWHKELVLISGALEALGGFGLLFPATRKYAAYGLIALLIAVFPANLNMAMHNERFSQIPAIVLWLRLPLQIVFILWTWACRK